jgi:Thioredoxin like C-terminal domain
MDQPMTHVADRTPTEQTTPESYLGYERLGPFSGSRVEPDREAAYKFPRVLFPDELAYSGLVNVERQRIVAGPDARLRLQFHAKQVNLVLGGTGPLRVYLDGELRRTVRVSGEPRLYTLLELPEVQDGLLELRFAPGLEGYAFTFG